MRDIIFLGFLSLIICSCQKETTPDRRPENPQSDSTTLSMYIDLDTTLASGLDTTSIQKYTYDNFKRIVQSDYTEYDGKTPSNLTQTKLFYNGADTLPFKKMESNYDLLSGNSAGEANTAYYFYKDAKIISDSANSQNNLLTYFVRKFSYNNNGIVETIADNSTPPILFCINFI